MICEFKDRYKNTYKMQWGYFGYKIKKSAKYKRKKFNWCAIIKSLHMRSPIYKNCPTFQSASFSSHS